MALLTLPSEEQEQRERSFQVLRNYLAATLECVRLEVSGPGTLADELLARQRTLPGYRRIRRRDPADESALRQALILSWASRVQLGLVNLGDDEMVIGYANAWAPVHAYYSVYGSVRAWLSSLGQGSNDHTAALNAISAATTSRSLLPRPWSVGCVGCCDVDRPIRFVGLPLGIEHDPRVQLLGNANPELAWPRYLKVLETTRSETLHRRYQDWCRQHGRKNTRAAEKTAIAAKVPSSTLFDVFWRLRVRANYRDAESFLMVSIPAAWHREFYDSLLQLCDLTTLLMENLVVQQVGVVAYERIVADFVRWNPAGGPAGFVADRLELLRNRAV